MGEALGGTDAHAKNYSILIGSGGLVRLAPLYDVASVYGYPGVDPRKAKLAMKIGGEYRLDRIWRRQWTKLAIDLQMDPDMVVQRILAMSAALPDCLADEQRRVEEGGLRHPTLTKLVHVLNERVRECSRRISTDAV